MPELNFETGLATYSLNGKCEVSFNPGDREFIEGFYNTVETLGKIQDEYGKKAEQMGGGKELFDLARERDTKMRKIIDDFFAAPVCDALFGNMSVCAIADGFPVWLNLVLAITDEIEAGVGSLEKQADPRVEKYTAKYKNYTNKVSK